MGNDELTYAHCTAAGRYQCFGYIAKTSPKGNLIRESDAVNQSTGIYYSFMSRVVVIVTIVAIYCEGNWLVRHVFTYFWLSEKPFFMKKQFYMHPVGMLSFLKFSSSSTILPSRWQMLIHAMERLKAIRDASRRSFDESWVRQWTLEYCSLNSKSIRDYVY